MSSLTGLDSQKRTFEISFSDLLDEAPQKSWVNYQIVAESGLKYESPVKKKSVLLIIAQPCHKEYDQMWMIGRDHHLTDKDTDTHGDEVTFSKLPILLVLCCLATPNLKKI